jgi:peptidoglycan/LPS O-acetylase OafA/YrhL
MPAPEEHRLPALDLLRGAAAFAVMLPHYFMYSANGTLPLAEGFSITAVEVFFVLSGFVLGPQIMLCATNRNWATLKTFWVRRWMRTIPSYLVALLCISVLFKQIWSSDFIRYAAYVQNLLWQHNLNDYYPVAWSLSVEEWYYVAFPAFLSLCGFALFRSSDVWSRCIAASLLFIALTTIARLFLGDPIEWGPHVRRVVAFRIDSIGYGFLLYLLVQRTSISQTTSSRWMILGLFLVTAALALFINMRMLSDDAIWLKHAFPFASALFGIAAILTFLSFNDLLRTRWLSVACIYFGRISYPVYLFHLVVLYLLVALGLVYGLTGMLLYFAVVVLCATLFFYGFEQPILVARPHYKSYGTEPLMSVPVS